MSREIKFRAWNDGEMFVGVGLTADSLTPYIIPESEENQESYLYMPEATLMQYTGLKDKNGIEIYEGDILGKHPYGYLKADGTKDGRYKGKEWDCFAVEWGEYDASEAGLVGGYEYETDGKYAGWNIIVGGYDSDLENYEVIGNIYENPELLQEANHGE